MLVVLVGVTGFVVKNVMTALYQLNKGDPARGNDRTAELEERLQRIEAATSSLLVDVSSMKEKQRFMARLQSSDGDISPMKTQNIPIVPRLGSPRL